MPKQQKPSYMVAALANAARASREIADGLALKDEAKEIQINRALEYTKYVRKFLKLEKQGLKR